MYRSAIIIFACVSVIANSWAADLDIQKEIQSYLSTKKYEGRGIGVVIKDVEDKSNLVSVNGAEMLNPASVSKLVTGAAAFELLGTNYQFSTRVFVDGTFDSDSGIVKGDLCFYGGGDPGLTAERLWLFAQHLYHLGIREIKGNLLFDDSFFDSVTVGPGFNDDSSSRAYLPLIGALSSSFNSIAIHHRTGTVVGSPVYIDVFPRISGLKIISTAKTVEPGKSGNIEIKTTASDLGTSIIIKGGMAVDESPRYTYRKVWQTWETFGGAILAQLNVAGIKVAGKMVHAQLPDSIISKKTLYQFSSEPLSVYLNAMFKYSNNFSSEMIYKTISAASGQPGSWSHSSSVIADWWKQNKLPGELQFQNGSGLGDVNRISAEQVVSLLSHVWNQKTYLPEYLSSLSVSGVDGTLKSRFRKSELKGIVRGKTGTLNSLSVSSLAGFLLKPGKTYAFAIICNNVGSGQYDNWMIQEGILEEFNKYISESPMHSGGKL